VFGPDIETGKRDMLLVMLGALIGLVKDVYGFEFGSSKDSARSSQAWSDYVKSGNGKG
jgi:hypothetical protein